MCLQFFYSHLKNRFHINVFRIGNWYHRINYKRYIKIVVLIRVRKKRAGILRARRRLDDESSTINYEKTASHCVCSETNHAVVEIDVRG